MPFSEYMNITRLDLIKGSLVKIWIFFATDITKPEAWILNILGHFFSYLAFLLNIE